MKVLMRKKAGNDLAELEQKALGGATQSPWPQRTARSHPSLAAYGFILLVTVSIMFLFCFSTTPLMAAETDFQALVADDSDAIVLERLPLEIEPVSLGLFQISPDEMDLFERPAPIREYLASLTGLSTFHSSKVLATEGIPLPSSAIHHDGKQMTIQIPSQNIFQTGRDVALSPEGEKRMVGVCEALAPYMGKPMALNVWARDVKQGQAQLQKIVSMLSNVLSIDPDEIETTIQVEPSEEEQVQFRVLGANL